jgi:hypothetical protein
VGRSQLTSERAELHRSLAAAIQRRNPESLEHNAALIAEHLEVAGDLYEAGKRRGWHPSTPESRPAVSAAGGVTGLRRPCGHRHKRWSDASLTGIAGTRWVPMREI